jgi:small GTP-binding protein
MKRRLALVGPTGAGKTSLVNYKIRGSIDIPAGPTIGYVYDQLCLPHRGADVTIDVFDTAGQERFQSLIPVHVRNVDVVLIVFDESDRASFESLGTWIEFVGCHAPDSAARVLVANKCDRPSAVPATDLGALTESCPVKVCFRTSALTGEGIDALFDWVLDRMWEASAVETTVLVAEPRPPPGQCVC